jgi:ribose-phosphate pyrophosphokinase
VKIKSVFYFQTFISRTPIVTTLSLAKTAKEFGAKAFVLLHRICLYASDKAFNTGESVTSTHFANLISGFADTLITTTPVSKKFFI